MIFKSKKQEEGDWWKGLKEAEDLYLAGFVHEGRDDIGCRIFKHPEGGSYGWGGMSYSFDRGMLDYIEHRKLNKEIYNG